MTIYARKSLCQRAALILECSLSHDLVSSVDGHVLDGLKSPHRAHRWLGRVLAGSTGLLARPDVIGRTPIPSGHNALSRIWRVFFSDAQYQETKARSLGVVKCARIVRNRAALWTRCG